MQSALRDALEGAHASPLSEAAARRLAEPSDQALPALMHAAAARRDRAYGADLTFSPKVFLPLTNLCRNFCDYCSFRRSPGMAGAWTMRPDEVRRWLERGQQQGAVEALLCLGDRPESVFPSYRAQLRQLGHGSTVEYLVWSCERALEQGLLPHTNAGLLTPDELLRLRPLNVSIGLMLENISPRLCEKGMPHHRARDKRPALRMQMMEAAGQLKMPFTTGILIGIGETALERVDSLLAIRALHARYGHIQEVIVQNFRTKPEIAMHDAQEPDGLEVAYTVALARLILPDDVSVQAPPNLNPGATAQLIAAGINDFGGISPVTPDYINPGHPWPHLQRLAEQCAALGRRLRARLPVYPRFADDGEFVDAALQPFIARARRGCERSAAQLAISGPGARQQGSTPEGPGMGALRG